MFFLHPDQKRRNIFFELQRVAQPRDQTLVQGRLILLSVVRYEIKMTATVCDSVDTSNVKLLGFVLFFFS